MESPIKTKKYRVIIGPKHVDFGAKNYSDYTIHHDSDRMKRYLMRHRSREDWSRKGLYTAGFWSRWLLWSKPSLDGAKKLMSKKFHINFVRLGGP